ncbi:hypothetical protein [Actinoallomurus sp. NPDC050550]|uniref:hypothetical protein n=1 Tax=Actinoallomurus sp. NPDC050550 TaxID=3154937 RepID=UPI0033EF1A43
MGKAAKNTIIIVGILGFLGLLIGGASWADSSKPRPTCGTVYMSPGTVCNKNGVATTYDEAVAEQQRVRKSGPAIVGVSAVLLVGSIVAGSVLERRRG